VLISDSRDARAADDLRQKGLRVECTQTIMRSPEDKASLAREVLASVSGLRDEPAGTAFRRLDQS